MKKKKFLLTTLVLLNVLHGSAYAAINEEPEAGKKYDEFLYYDCKGTKDFSFQGFEWGETHHYYFNEGATLDATNCDDHATILSSNWNKRPNDKTYEIFHIGKNKDFTLINYRGYGNLNVHEKANLHILGGNVVLESGVDDTDNLDNGISSIGLEDNSRLKIDSESLYIGNNRDDRYSTGAMYINDASQVDIDVDNNFTAKNVDFGIIIQTTDENTAKADIHAGGDITIKAKRSDEQDASGYRGAGIYSLAYLAKDGVSKVNFTSDNGNITIEAQGYGYYGYGNTQAEFIAKKGNVNITSTDKYGVYASSNDAKTNKVIFDAKEVNIQGYEYSIVMFNDAVTDITATETTINGHIYSEDSDVNIKSNTTNVNGCIQAYHGTNILFFLKKILQVELHVS